MSQTNRVVVITGGAQGIGFGIAECFAKQGASIVIADMREDAAKDAAATLIAAGASDTMGIGCDVSKRESVETMVGAVIGRFGHIDVLVNNAGISPFINVMEMLPETWDKVIGVNLNGAFHCTQLIAKGMIEDVQAGRAPGRIVFITSLAENVTQPSQVEYGASKGGMRMLMRGFATALGPYGIVCNAVAPGMIMTPMTSSYWTQPEPAEQIKTRVPVGRIGTPADIGRAVVFLADPENEYINGTTLLVDGGYSAVVS